MYLCLFLFTYTLVYADAAKWINVGRYHRKIVDYADQGEAGPGRNAYYYFDDFGRVASVIYGQGWQIGVRDWTDENGEYHPFQVSGCARCSSDEFVNTMPVPDDEGITIRRYMRYQPPAITVDGFRLDDPFPLAGDEVSPDKIPGTADVMVESWINTLLGVTIHQRVFGWSQANHDDYLLYDWSFINTGNVDLDDEIELPNQTINDLYYWRLTRWGRIGKWLTAYGQSPGDTLRMQYAYPEKSQAGKVDDMGYRRSRSINTKFLDYVNFMGEAYLHVDTSPTDKTDDITQPQMTGYNSPEIVWTANETSRLTQADRAALYENMQFGFLPWDGYPEMTGVYPGTHHSVPMDQMGLEFEFDFGWGWENRASAVISIGPRDLAPGESVRMVFVDVLSSISREVAWEVGKAWTEGTCTWPGSIDDLGDYYPVWLNYPDLAPTYNDQAKDRWILSAKDSLFNNANAAQWAVRNDYEVPIPPPSPSIEVMSLPDRIKITWGNESESVSDFAGYRVYRSVGNAGPWLIENELIGSWHCIFECGDGTDNPLTHSYEDNTAERGQAHFYYVAAFDDGVGNILGFRGQREILESGEFLNRTTMGAYLTRTAGTLSTVRIVPNPFNIGARELQYIGEPDKIMFLDLPGYCTIKIYTESGDLVKTLYHTDGSGDESWGVLLDEHSATETGQIIVSGIYIAVIEQNNEDGTPTGESTAVKFVIVR